MIILLSLVAPEVAIMTGCCVTSEDKIAIMKTLGFQCTLNVFKLGSLLAVCIMQYNPINAMALHQIVANRPASFYIFSQDLFKLNHQTLPNCLMELHFERQFSIQCWTVIQNGILLNNVAIVMYSIIIDCSHQLLHQQHHKSDNDCKPCCNLKLLSSIWMISVRDLWKSAWPCKQLHLLCLSNPWNLSGTVLLRGFQSSHGALKSTEYDSTK